MAQVRWSSGSTRVAALATSEVVFQTISPPIHASSPIVSAVRVASLHDVARPIAKSDGRLIAGPANRTAAAAPAGAPMLTSVKARGISKNVGSASGTAIAEASAIAAIFPLPDANT